VCRAGPIGKRRPVKADTVVIPALQDIAEALRWDTAVSLKFCRFTQAVTLTMLSIRGSRQVSPVGWLLHATWATPVVAAGSQTVKHHCYVRCFCC
jgi:hypothetical protein